MSTFKKKNNVSGQQIETYFLFLEQLNTDRNFTSENKTKQKKGKKKGHGILLSHPRHLGKEVQFSFTNNRQKICS